jgi:hypothetical protein
VCVCVCVMHASVAVSTSISVLPDGRCDFALNDSWSSAPMADFVRAGVWLPTAGSPTAVVVSWAPGSELVRMSLSSV